MSTGFTTPYFYITSLDSRDKIYNAVENYSNNPQKVKENISKFVNTEDYVPNELLITIDLYMANVGEVPDENLLNELTERLQAEKGLPRGSYTISLHDNRIGIKSATGNKENSLILIEDNEIIIE